MATFPQLITVGNEAGDWLYLTLMCCCRGEKLKLDGAWLNDASQEGML